LLQLLSNPKGPNNREKIKSLFKQKQWSFVGALLLFVGAVKRGVCKPALHDVPFHSKPGTTAKKDSQRRLMSS
jgi:hypothetical protein